MRIFPKEKKLTEGEILKAIDQVKAQGLPVSMAHLVFRAKREAREKIIEWQKTYACFAYWRGPVDRAETYHEDYLDGLGSCDSCGRVKPGVEFIPARLVGLDTLACEQCRERRDNYQRHESYPVRLQNKGGGWIPEWSLKNLIGKEQERPPLEVYTVALCISVHSSLQQPDSIWCSYPRKDRYNRDNIFKP